VNLIALSTVARFFHYNLICSGGHVHVRAVHILRPPPSEYKDDHRVKRRSSISDENIAPAEIMTREYVPSTECRISNQDGVKTKGTPLDWAGVIEALGNGTWPWINKLFFILKRPTHTKAKTNLPPVSSHCCFHQSMLVVMVSHGRSIRG
jgi:hypothetical protein